MIQRIQSVYLLIALLAIVVMFFFPLAYFYGDMFYFSLNMKGVSDNTWVQINTIPLIVKVFIISLLIATGAFTYRNRLLQVKILRFGVLLSLAFIIVLYFGYIDNIVKKAGVAVQYKAGIYFPLIVLVFQVLAIRAILNDEKKVRAADRLR